MVNYTSACYKAAWSVMGEAVVGYIMKFFDRPYLPMATNSTILTLIPKFLGDTLIKDYIPISCCNTVYKTISKIPVAKLKPLIPKIILPNQTTFIKGRLWMENCLLASEIVSGYHKDKKPQRLAIKIDIAKAFEWNFILSCLAALNFSPIYISWIKECISTIAYSVGINGSIYGFFKGTRGIRQGDPPSPYLFGLAMNVLSQKLNQAAEEQKFGYHPKYQDSKLTHMCFADDLFIYSDGAPASVQGIIEVLSDFHLLSGLAISPEKSCFFALGLSTTEVTAIVTSSDIPQG